MSKCCTQDPREWEKQSPEARLIKGKICVVQCGSVIFVDPICGFIFKLATTNSEEVPRNEAK